MKGKELAGGERGGEAGSRGERQAREERDRGGC